MDKRCPSGETLDVTRPSKDGNEEPGTTSGPVLTTDGELSKGNEEPDGGLGSGSIIGITIAVLFVFGLAVGGGVFYNNNKATI